MRAARARGVEPRARAGRGRRRRPTLDRRSFYTALYHALLHPNVFSDVDGRYLGFDDAAARRRGPRRSTRTSRRWDTYKAQNQLLALIQPRALPRHAALAARRPTARAGKLPRWGEQNIDAAHMSGDPAIPMIADGVCRGLLDARRGARRCTTRRVDLVRAPPAGARRSSATCPMQRRARRSSTASPTSRSRCSPTRSGDDDDARRWRARLAELPQPARPRDALDPPAQRRRDAGTTPFDPDRRDRLPGGQLVAVLVARAARRARPVRPHGRRRRGGRAARPPLPLPARGADRAERCSASSTAPTQYAPGNEHDLQVPWMYAFAGQPWRTQAELRDLQHALPPDARRAARQRRPRLAVGLARVVGARLRPGHAGRAVLRARLARSSRGPSCGCRGGRRSPCRRPGRR